MPTFPGHYTIYFNGGQVLYREKTIFSFWGGAFRLHTQVRGIASTVIRPQNRLEGQDAAVLRHLEAQGVFQTEGAPACPAEGPFCELAPHFIIVEK